MLISTVSTSPMYFTIWLNNGARLAPYMQQLQDQNSRFGDVLIVDNEVYPSIEGHGNVMLDADIYQAAKENSPDLAPTISKLEAVYYKIKSTNPAAASDILRFVGFLGLGGDEFVYHDVDVKIGNAFSGRLPQPISSAMIGSVYKNHLGKNWIEKSVRLPTREVNIDNAHINTDLIGVIRSEAMDFLTEYVTRSSQYYEKLATTNLFLPDGTSKSILDVITTSDTSVLYRLDAAEDPLFLVDDDELIFRIRTSGLDIRKFQSFATWGASITQFENILQKFFVQKYYVEIEEDDSPYATVNRKFTFSQLNLGGEITGVVNFLNDYVADPVLLGAISRKNNIDWHGISNAPMNDVPTLDIEPFVEKESDYEYETYETYDSSITDDFESSDEEPLRETLLEAGATSIDLSGPIQSARSILPSFNCDFRRRRKRQICPMEDENNYEISKTGVVLFRNKWLVYLTSKYIVVYDPLSFERYKYTPTEAVRQRVSTLNRKVVDTLERFLRLPSGRQMSTKMNGKYTRLLSSFENPQLMRKQISVMAPISGTMSPAAKKFTRSSFGVGYITSLAFNTQFISSAVNMRNNSVHRIAMATIGSVGIAEISYISTVKLTSIVIGSPHKLGSVLPRIFKVLNVATAVYFGVDSALTLAENPAHVESWWWLSRSVTIFTPLNKYFIPLDITFIITKQIVGASWDLSLQQNRMILDYKEQEHYHAMSFFGISTQLVDSIHNNGIFRMSIVNPTVDHLKSVLEDDKSVYAVVGYPSTTVCKSTEKVIYNNINEYETNVDSFGNSFIQTRIDSLATTRMRTCFNDAEALCLGNNLSFWDWFVGLFARAWRVRSRGADLGVGCILLDGTRLTGSACSQRDVIARDIANRERVVLVLPTDPHTLPLFHPRKYTFNYVSVANGSISESTTSGCESVLKWSSTISPYILVNRGKNYGQVDYIGIPSNGDGTLFRVYQNNKARVYMYKLNQNNRVDNITIQGSANHENEFILLNINDEWTIHGGSVYNKLVLMIGSTVEVENSTIRVSGEAAGKMTAYGINYFSSKVRNMTISVKDTNSTIVASGSTVNVAEGSTVPFIHLFDGSNLTIGERANVSVIITGGENVMSLKAKSIGTVSIVNGSISIETHMYSVLHLKAKQSFVNITANPFSSLYVYDLQDNDTISVGDHLVTINNNIVVNRCNMILFFKDYYVVIKQYGKANVVLTNFNQDNVVSKFSGQDILVHYNNTVFHYITVNGTIIPSDKYSFVVNSNLSVIVPYQTRKQLDFYGSGNVTVQNEMIECSRTSNCKVIAHVNCKDPIKLCKW